MESNSVWHHTLLGFYLCQSRKHETCVQYHKKKKLFSYCDIGVNFPNVEKKIA